MPYHIETITKRVHKIPSTLAADPATALQVAASGSVVPLSTTHVKARKVLAKRTRNGTPPPPLPYVHLVTTFEVTLHAISDADAGDKTAALAIAASGKVAPLTKRTNICAARVSIRRPVPPTPVAPPTAHTLPPSL